MEMKGRVIKEGKASGEALVTKQPISFFGGVDLDTGTIVEKNHELENICVAGKVLVFPRGKGSTVGSYAIYRMKKAGKAPVAIVCEETETIVAVGAIISGIPMVDMVDISKIKTGDKVTVDGETVSVG